MYDEIVGEGGWAADRVVMGVLTNPGDGGSGFVGLETLKSVLSSLGGKYPTFGCAVGWEYWAAGTGDGLEKPWMWVKALGEVISGAGAGGENSEEATSSAPPAPSNGTATSSGDQTEGNSSESPAASSSSPPSRPRKDPPTPWPSQMQQLESVGAGHWDSVRALNMTSGQLGPAGDLLGVTDLLNDILGQVDGVLESLPLA